MSISTIINLVLILVIIGALLVRAAPLLKWIKWPTAKHDGKSHRARIYEYWDGLFQEAAKNERQELLDLLPRILENCEKNHDPS